MLEAMDMLGFSPLLAQVWFISFSFMSELVARCVELNDVKQKYLRKITRCVFCCFAINNSNNVDLSPFWFS